MAKTKPTHEDLNALDAALLLVMSKAREARAALRVPVHTARYASKDKWTIPPGQARKMVDNAKAACAPVVIAAAALGTLVDSQE